jgi:uncharacterized protein (TIGR00290 family)
VTAGYDRVSIHGVRRGLLHAQGNALGLPVEEVVLQPRCSNADYEAAFIAGLERIRAAHPGARRIAFGDLFLEDVRAYREELVARAGWEPVFPLWGLDTKALAARFVASGYRAHLVCVDTTQLAADFAGAQFTDEMLARLPASVDPCGERGEFHTFVSAGPIFSHPIPVTLGEVVLREGRFAYADLLEGPHPAR